MAHDDHHVLDGEIGIAHISDLHFGFGKPKDGEDAWKLIEQILGKLKPSLLLVSGDLVDTPKKEHFDNAIKKLHSMDIPYYACLGNHDWYRKGNRLDHRLMFGNFSFRMACSATWVLAALASYHGIGWWCLGFLALATSPWFGPWLISSLWNAVGNDLYDEDFKKRILCPSRAVPCPLPREKGPEWKIGLLGMDSSVEADVSARGFVNSKLFMPLEDATKNQDWDLCICLIHHHPISIRGLEKNCENDRLRLLNVTSLVNSGSLLEALVRAQVDLLLHGHEHEPNWVTYNSCKPGYEPLRVVAAGSATGMGSDGYDSARATFNLIILAPDRSVRLRRYYYYGSEWKAEEDVPLFDAASLRQARLRRALAARRILSELTKHVEFTRERDIWVSWEFRNWLLPKQEFVQKIWNTTGEPADVTAQISFADAGEHIYEFKPSCEPVLDEKHSWEIRWPVKPEWIGSYARVRIGYRWQGGGVLTGEEMRRIRNAKLAGDTPRLEGQEYETVWTPVAVAAAQLIVVLPQEYAPDGPPNIRVEKEVQVPGPTPMDPLQKKKQKFPGEVSELRQYLSFPAKGIFALRVPYPFPYYDYTLSWEPVSEATVAKQMANDLPEKRFREVAQSKGKNLLESFANIMEGRGHLENVSLALYVREDLNKELTLLRIDWMMLGPEKEHGPEPPSRIPFTGERQATTLAWWGQPQIVQRPPGEVEASAFGFTHPDEMALCGVPLRFNLQSMTNPPPWGLVRIGVIKSKGTGLQASNVMDILQALLPAATTALLSAALQETS